MSNRVLSQLSIRPQAPNIYGFVPSEDLDWQEQALCAQTDPEAHFPEKGQSTRAAKDTCQVCPVRAECLDFALTNNEAFGVWGGLSARERRELKRQAREDVAA